MRQRMGQFFPFVRFVYLVFRNLFFWVVLQQITKSFLESMYESPELCLEDFFIEEIADAKTAPGHLRAICWALLRQSLVRESFQSHH
jgi:hypothetical protein